MPSEHDLVPRIVPSGRDAKNMQDGWVCRTCKAERHFNFLSAVDATEAMWRWRLPSGEWTSAAPCTGGDQP